MNAILFEIKEPGEQMWSQHLSYGKQLLTHI